MPLPYLVVLGLEAVLARAFGAMLFGEHPNIGRLLGLGLLIVGIVIETGSASAATTVGPGRRGAQTRPT